jgi:hypothetical protein
LEALNEHQRQLEEQHQRQLEEQRRRELEDQHRRQIYEHRANIVKEMTLNGEDFLMIMKFSELPKDEILSIQNAM